MNIIRRIGEEGGSLHFIIIPESRQIEIWYRPRFGLKWAMSLAPVNWMVI